MTTQIAFAATIAPASVSTARSVLRSLASCARAVRRLVFFVFGLDETLHLIPQPDPAAARARAVALGWVRA